MTINPWDTTGPSIFTTNKTKADVSREVQAKLQKKPRGKEAPIKGRGPIKDLNANIPKGKTDAKT
jgi:hypothetical protein